MQIAIYADGTKTEEGKKLADSINKILSNIEAATEDMLGEMIREAVKSGAGHLAEYGIKNGVSFLNKTVAEAVPLYKAIIEGLVTGVTTANFITNMDDMAYYGHMMMTSGVLSIYARAAMTGAERELRIYDDYAAALYYDMAFHIFKEIQLAACDYAIGYRNSIASAPLGYVFKYT